MCYSPNDLPPNPPDAAGQASGQDIVLTSADGTRFLAYHATPTSTQATAAVLIYPDVRGLHNFYKELALRFAEQGIDALAIDYFGRTADLTTPRDDSFDYMPHVQQIHYPSFLSDVQAALSYIENQTTISSTQNLKLRTQNFTLGFCMGGALSLMTAAEDLPLSGVVAFYSGFGRKFTLPDGTQVSALDRSPNIHVPVLGLYGGADQGIPQEQIDQLDSNLTAAGVDHEIVVYPDAPHSFFDRKFAEFANESADSWTRVLNFIRSRTM
jgi:carboxymethylenebutenolidase